LFCDKSTYSTRTNNLFSRKGAASKQLVVHLDDCSVRTNRASKDWFEEHGIRLMRHSGYSSDLASSDFYLFSIVKEKLEWIQVTDEDQLFECLQEILSGLDQQELNNIFQACVGRIQEVSQGKTRQGKARQSKVMDTMSDDRQFPLMLVLFNFIRRGWRMYLCTR
jgi:hypothetical protein